jgi:hypothetical protein
MNFMGAFIAQGAPSLAAVGAPRSAAVNARSLKESRPDDRGPLLLRRGLR